MSDSFRSDRCGGRIQSTTLRQTEYVWLERSHSERRNLMCCLLWCCVLVVVGRTAICYRPEMDRSGLGHPNEWFVLFRSCIDSVVQFPRDIKWRDVRCNQSPNHARSQLHSNQYITPSRRDAISGPAGGTFRLTRSSQPARSLPTADSVTTRRRFTV